MTSVDEAEAGEHALPAAAGQAGAEQRARSGSRAGRRRR